MNKKYILDACCGCRQMWFDKKQKNTVYIDIRYEPKGFIPEQPNCSIEPDLICDFKKLPFKDESFKLIAWDIPHILGDHVTGIIMKKYGYLNKLTWENDIKSGFQELWRCLENYGIIEMKFNDVSVPVSKILSLFPEKPLFGTPTKKGVNNTYWFCFMKGVA